VEVVHYTVLFLVSLAHSFKDVVHPALCGNENLRRWLKRLTLESPEVSKCKFEVLDFSPFLHSFVIVR
jgi:hypothetical protein